MVEGDEVYVLVVRSRTVPDPLQLPAGWKVVIPPSRLGPVAELAIRLAVAGQLQEPVPGTPLAS